MKNNVFGKLTGGMGASTTSKLMQTNINDLIDVGDRVTISRGTHPNVTQREIVLVESKTVAGIIVTRAYELCRLSDTASLESQTPFEWLPGDYFSVNNTAGAIQEMQDDIDSRLLNGTLRDNLPIDNRILAINNGNDESGIAYGTSGKVLTSNGTTSLPSFKAIPEQMLKDKNEITEITPHNSYLWVTDPNDSSKNKKILLDNFKKEWGVIPSNNKKAQVGPVQAKKTNNSTALHNWVNVGRITVGRNVGNGGNATISAGIKFGYISSYWASSGSMGLRIQKNNSTLFSQTWTVPSSGSSYQSHQVQSSIQEGDIINFKLYVNINSSVPTTQTLVTFNYGTVAYDLNYENFISFENTENTYTI